MTHPQQTAIGNYPSIHGAYFLSSITILFLNHACQVAFTLQEETLMEFNFYISFSDTCYKLSLVIVLYPVTALNVKYE
jgi:hypothetical protein